MRYVLAAALMALALPAAAAEYFVAPIGAAAVCAADGSAACPWPSLDAAFAAGKITGGDTITLPDGDYGAVTLGAAFDKDVTIRSQNSKAARFSGVQFNDSARRIVLKDLSVWGSDGSGSLIRAFRGAAFITLDGIDVRGRPDVADRLNWSVARWTEVTGDGQSAGIELRGPNAVVRNSTVTAVRIGIIAWGDNSVVENNVVDGFTNDGMKGGTGGLFRGNRVMNRFSIDDSHSDGFQAYSREVIANLTLDGNVFLEWTYAKTHPLRGSLQGISLFNGPYEDIVIQNNIVATRHFNGIAVLNATRVKIVNNTVVNIDGIKGLAPWIRVGGSDILVANNVAMQVPKPPHGSVTVAANVVAGGKALFMDAARFDFRPVADSLLGKANPSMAPAFDQAGTRRGARPDVGALQTTCTKGNGAGKAQGVACP